jgi:hypothetical protein
VSRIIFLDTGPLGMVTQRKGVPVADACRQWVSACLDRGACVIVPAIADFEVRRELVRANKSSGLATSKRDIRRSGWSGPSGNRGLPACVEGARSDRLPTVKVLPRPSEKATAT